MAVSDRTSITVVKDMGLVTAVFDERTLSSLQGDLALGHVRYSTTGPSTWHNAQPVYRSIGAAGFALGHNGNLTNTRALVAEAGMLPGVTTSDSDLVAELLAREQPPDRPYPLTDEAGDEDVNNDRLETALNVVLPRLEGAFSFGLMDDSHLVGVRDPHGFRPLCLGRLDLGGGHRTGWVIASESPALAVVGARFVREIDPGEMVVIDEAGPRQLEALVLRADRTAAVRIRVRLLRATRQRAARSRGLRGPPAHG